jgi:hypothetical protein
MAALTEWLQIMLGEIARKQEDLERAREEEAKRDTEKRVDPEQSAQPEKIQRAS